MASDTESEIVSPAASTPSPAPKSKGIKRTLGGRKAELTPEPTAESPKAKDTSEPESARATVVEKPKGIKRTLGGRRAPSKDPEPSPQLPTNKQANGKDAQDIKSEQKQDETVGEAANEDDAADRKREALKRQLANAGATKPKKRKF